MKPQSSPPAAGHSPQKLSPLDLRQVKVGGEIGRRIDVTVHNNLLVLDAEKDFLPPFFAKTADSGYVGLGKLIDAAVKLAAYTGDDRVIAFKRRLIDRALAAQEPDGYLGMMAPPHRMWGMWDIHEMGYLAWGLLTDHRYFDEGRSLESAIRIADYILARWHTMPRDWEDQTLVAVHVAVTGLERTLIELSRRTGDRKYVDFCLNERELAEWDPEIVIGRRPLIEGHIYGYMTRCLAQLELYRTHPNPGLLAATRKAIDFMTRRNGMAINGATGQYEIWTDDQDVRGDLGETCATAYQLRVYDAMLRLTGEPQYGDLMERTIHNALFAAQSPDGRRIRYYVPLEGERIYFHLDTYCCPCNYRRIVSELPTFVYYRSPRGISINLYTPSQATFDLDGGGSVAIRQETDYPSSDTVMISLDPPSPSRFLLRLRIPKWAAAAEVRINDDPLDRTVTPGKFLEIERQWKPGDRVTLGMPLEWRFVSGRQRNAGRVAVMRGPMIFCLNPSGDAELAGLDGADLGRITIAPESIRGPEPDDSVRPGGVSCRVGAWKPGYSTKLDSDFEVRLTEVADPGGMAAYFRLRDMIPAEDDELLGGDGGSP